MFQKIKKIAFYGLLILALLIGAAFLALKLPEVQHYLGRYIASYLSEKTGTSVTIDKTRFSLFKFIELDDMLVFDQHNDTLFYVKTLKADLSKLKLLNKRYVIKSLEVDQLYFNLKRYKNEDQLNFAFFIDSLSTDGPKDPSKSDFKLKAQSVVLQNCHFIYQDQNVSNPSYGILFSDLDVKAINARFKAINLVNDSIQFTISNLKAKDKSGFDLKSLQTSGWVSGSGLNLEPIYLQANQSVIDAGQLALRYSNWGDYASFIDKVKMKGDFHGARIRMQDVAYFAGDLKDWDQTFVLDGLISGKVNNLSGTNIKLKTGQKTQYSGDFNLDGLPNISSTFLTVQADALVTHASDIGQFPAFPLEKGKTLEVPAGLFKMGALRFKGEFTGFLNDFVAYGALKTDKGQVISDVSLKQMPNDTLVIKGRFQTKNLGLNALFESESLGMIDSDLGVTLKSVNQSFVSGRLEGRIDRLGFNNYDYRAILLNGYVTSDQYTGVLSIDDPSLLLDFDGRIVLSDQLKDLDFKAQLYHADLGALNLLPIKHFSSLSADFEWTAKGFEYEDMLGEIVVENLNYCTDDTLYDFGRIYLKTDTLGGLNSIDLISNQFDLSLYGVYDLPNLWNDFKSKINGIVSVFGINETDINSVNQDFTFSIGIRDLSFFEELDIIPFTMASGSEIKGYFNSDDYAMNLNLLSEFIAYDDFTVRYPEVFMVMDSTEFFVELLLDGLAYKESEASLNNSTFIARAFQDSLLLDFDWRQNDQKYGQGQVLSAVNGPGQFDILFKDVGFTALKTDWNLNDSAFVLIDTNWLVFDGIELSSSNQEIAFNGTLTKGKNDTLNVSVSGFDLANFNYFLNQLDYSIDGLSSGTIAWVENGDEFKLESSMEIDSAIINDYYLGDVFLKSEKATQDSAYLVQLRLLNNTFENLRIDGAFSPNSRGKNTIDFDVNFDDFQLDFINSIKVPGISKVGGTAKGLVNISGTLDKPVLDGALKILDGGVTVEVIGSHLSFNTTIDFKKDFIGIDPFYLYDSKNHRALAYGTVLHDHLKDWNFNLDVELENFESLNLGKDEDALYYGKAYATGDFNIAGYADKIYVTVNAVTEPGTEVAIPIGGNSTIEKQDLVTFINYNTDLDRLEEMMRKRKLNGIDMELNIKVTPDATISLEFDEITGDVLRVRAKGLINLALNNEGEFSMKGTLETVSGEYLFSMESIINKKFSIEPGSRITWFGDPYDAKIDIKAVYKTRAALYPIMTVNQERYRNRVNVEVGLFLKEQLLTPAISFDILLPDSDEPERAALQNATITTQDLNLQVVSLLLFGSFQPLAGSSNSDNFAAVNSYEMLSNQVSNMLSGLSDNVDINVNYRPETSTSGQEFAVGFSTTVLDERLSISTDLGVRDNSVYGGENVNNIVGDFVAEYELFENGPIRLKVFNKSNDYQSTAVLKQAPYTQGVGLIYRKDFDGNYKGKPSDNDKLQEKYDKKSNKDDKALKPKKEKEDPVMDD